MCAEPTDPFDRSSTVYSSHLTRLSVITDPPTLLTLSLIPHPSVSPYLQPTELIALDVF